MSEIAISLSSGGHQGTHLRATVGNELLVAWVLTDAQLAYLAAEAVSILKARSQSGVLKAVSQEEILKRLGDINDN